MLMLVVLIKTVITKDGLHKVVETLREKSVPVEGC